MSIEVSNLIDKEKIKNKISSVSSLVFLVTILFLTLISLVVFQYFNNKKISEGLQGVYITDVNDRSATVSWVTSSPVKTELVYSTEKISFFSQFSNAKAGYDKRDLIEVADSEYKLQKRGKYFTHSVILRDLEPESEYFFALKNGLFLDKSSYINFFSTTVAKEDIQTPDVAYGNVFNQNGELISDTLIVFELTNTDDTNKSQQVSYITDGKTGWSVNLSNLLDSELKEKYEKSGDSYLSIYIINSTGEINNIFEYSKIRPTENISAYDNNEKEKESDVKGVMAVACECTTCNPTCPSGYHFSGCDSAYNCVSTKSTCTSRDACTGQVCETITGPVCYKETTKKQTTVVACECTTCKPTCPSGYHFSGCDSAYDCVSTKSTCTSRDACTGKVCETITGPVCYKETTKKETCGCDSCTPYCPTGFSFTRPSEEWNYETAVSTCNKFDSCIEQKCGSQRGAVCYKQTTQKTPTTYTPESCTARYEKYGTTGLMTSFFWCNCKTGKAPACVAARDLAITYSSSCLKYCENPVTKSKICGQGELKDCEYGCQDNGPTKDDICKPKPNEIPQEIECFKKKDATSCKADVDCQWSYTQKSCVVASAPVVTPTSCSSITTSIKCNETKNCEYINGKCQEVDTSGYVVGWANEGTTNAYCTGLLDSNGKIIGVNDGTSSIRTHQNNSSCSIDVLAYEVDLGSQMPGYNSQQGTWDAGYKCRVGEYQANGYGNNVIITQPNGKEVIYAHLKEASCDGVIKTGQSGNVNPHLHVEVVCSSGDCGNCLGDKNPCSAIPGGCFSCTNTVKIAAVKENTTQTTGVKDTKDLFSLISKVKAADYEYLNPADLIADLALPEGTYNVKSGSTSKTTSFVKTDNTHIVFFEDDNDNGVLDSGEAILSPYEAQVEYKVSYERIADSYQLSLDQGLNLLSFPVILKDGEGKEIKKVSELVTYLNEKGADITTVAAYRGGQFLPYVLREDKGFGEDFNLLPGEGYFLISHSKIELLLSGNKIKDGLEIQLYEGWNLVNIYNSAKQSYLGFDVLKQMQEQSVDANILSRWEDGAYDSVVSEESGQYGTDFNIYQGQGYFVRVEGKSGPYTPK